MMDWAAQLLGLSPTFYNSSGNGGGVIMVRIFKLSGCISLTSFIRIFRQPRRIRR
jgi:hypothetical protein